MSVPDEEWINGVWLCHQWEESDEHALRYLEMQEAHNALLSAAFRMAQVRHKLPDDDAVLAGEQLLEWMAVYRSYRDADNAHRKAVLALVDLEKTL